jgi:hypothetical protein
MPYLTNQIDAYTFDSMEGNFQPVRERVEVIQRGGVDGTEMRRLGASGRPFQILTRRFESTTLTARTAFDNYASLIGQTPVAIIQHGVSYPGTWGVLDVVNTGIAPRTSVVGLTIVSSPTVILLARWTLIQITTL